MIAALLLALAAGLVWWHLPACRGYRFGCGAIAWIPRVLDNGGTYLLCRKCSSHRTRTLRARTLTNRGPIA